MPRVERDLVIPSVFAESLAIRGDIKRCLDFRST